MYKFKDTVRDRGSAYELPPEAMFINGEAIEEHIDGYTTLNVQGRELVAQSVRNKTGSFDGAYFTGANYGVRQIKVTYMLVTKNNDKFRDAFDYINFMLSQKEAKFKFLDDPSVEWVGTVSSVEEVPAGSNKITSSFTITCSNPFKQSIYAIESKGVGEVQIMEPIRFGTVPDEIAIALKENAKDVTIINHDLKIELHGDYKAGKEMILKPENSQVTYDGKSAVSDLAFLTDFENFEVKLDDVIKVTPASSSLSLKVRGRRL